MAGRGYRAHPYGPRFGGPIVNEVGQGDHQILAEFSSILLTAPDVSCPPWVPPGRQRATFLATQFARDVVPPSCGFPPLRARLNMYRRPLQEDERAFDKLGRGLFW